MFRRLHLNLPAAASSPSSTLAAVGRVRRSGARRVVSDRRLPVFVAVDASAKHDVTAIVPVRVTGRRRSSVSFGIACSSRRRRDPLDFEASIEASLLWLRGNFRVVQMVFDFVRCKHRAAVDRAGVIVEDIPPDPAES